MLIRCASILALAAASSFALAAAPQAAPQPPTNATSNMTGNMTGNVTGAGDNDMQAPPPTSAEPSESTEPANPPSAPMSSSNQGMSRRMSGSSRAGLDAALQHAAVACDSELRTYCSNTASGNGQVLACLNSHRANASDQCQAALDRVQASNYPPASSSRRQVQHHKAVMHHRVHHRKATKRPA